MNYKIISFTIGLFFSVLLASGQDSIPKIKEIKNITKFDSTVVENDAGDKLAVGKKDHNNPAKITQELDTVQDVAFKDHARAAQIDKQWLEELYSNVLFDSIYESVTTLKFDPVDYPELTTDTLKARLKRLNARTPFNVEYNPSLESVIKSYLKYRRNSMSRLMSLSHYYFPLFEESLDNYDIPLEVKYLAIVESALKPKARSRVGATGLWQFMYGTGKEHGLDVSSYVDERSDPIKSTVAASQYLARLYNIFGDWDLALAAYNSGPGNVSKAIRRSGGYKNYWNIRPHLPRETAGYLPAFLATMYIFEFAEAHGFRVQPPQYHYVETDTIHVKQMITLDQVSELVDVPMETLQFLNPSYKLDIIPFIKGENYTLRLPQEAIGRFVTNEKSIYEHVTAELNTREKPLPQFFDTKNKTRYRVKSGDYLGKIARKFGVRVSQLKRWNGLRSNNLKIGQRLTVYPAKPGLSSVKKKPLNTPKKRINTKGKVTYKVNDGDSLWSIAQKFPGVSVENIKEWNDISSSKLKIGTTLVVSE